jgi:hypothetical protein
MEDESSGESGLDSVCLSMIVMSDGLSGKRRNKSEGRESGTDQEGDFCEKKEFRERFLFIYYTVALTLHSTYMVIQDN